MFANCKSLKSLPKNFMINNNSYMLPYIFKEYYDLYYLYDCLNDNNNSDSQRFR